MTCYRKDLKMKTGRLGKPMEHTLCFDSDASWDLELAEFYDVIIGRRPLRQGTAEQAVRVMELIETIYARGLPPA